MVAGHPGNRLGVAVLSRRKTARLLLRLRRDATRRTREPHTLEYLCRSVRQARRHLANIPVKGEGGAEICQTYHSKRQIVNPAMHF